MLRKTRFVAILAAMTILAGCASEYVISTTSGVMIPTKGKPKLDEDTGIYSYEDSEGRENTINKSEVAQVMER